MIEPLISRTEVACDQKTAFTVFVEQMGAWWPLRKRSMSLKFTGQPAKELRVDARAGGKIVEVGSDGAEHHWGTYKRVVPHEFVSMDFHMGMPPDKASVVEVRFRALGPARTAVELVQSNWEGFGDMAEMLRGGYVSGWPIIFEDAYTKACAAPSASASTALRGSAATRA